MVDLDLIDGVFAPLVLTADPDRLCGLPVFIDLKLNIVDI